MKSKKPKKKIKNQEENLSLQLCKEYMDNLIKLIGEHSNKWLLKSEKENKERMEFESSKDYIEFDFTREGNGTDVNIVNGNDFKFNLKDNKKVKISFNKDTSHFVKDILKELKAI